MKIRSGLVLSLLVVPAFGFQGRLFGSSSVKPRLEHHSSSSSSTTTTTTSSSSSCSEKPSSFATPIFGRQKVRLAGMSFGLGPDPDEPVLTLQERLADLVPGIDYEVPDHESYRTSRRTKLDEICDDWYGDLLGQEGDTSSFLEQISTDIRQQVLTPVELVNEEYLPVDDPDYTPYVNFKLPWTPLVPAYGLEQYGIPVPRRNAETWRQFDVMGMARTDYSGNPVDVGVDVELTQEEVETYRDMLTEKGVWLDDEEAEARLVYINGRYCPGLSKPTEEAHNMKQEDWQDNEEVETYLRRLTDGFTDELAAPVLVEDWDEPLTSFANLSKPDHNVGNATSQFAINSQQGTACFAALNSIKTGAVAYIRQPSDKTEAPKPILVIMAMTKDGGADPDADPEKGVNFHPRMLAVAEENSQLALVQSIVDLDVDNGIGNRQKLYNGYTQIFVKAGANVTHTYLEETGGIVTPGTHFLDKDLPEGQVSPRTIERARPPVNDTLLETLDAHVMGEAGSYEGVVLNIGGGGRMRLAAAVSLLGHKTHAGLNGFLLCGGIQRADVKSTIHHIAEETTSQQLQKNMVAGRATGAFRGRIRVEQSAQQTDGQQLCRTILLNNKCKAYAIPSLEVIADDVKCAHGATVADLPEEQINYFLTRGIQKELATKVLMNAFALEIFKQAHPAVLKSNGNGIQDRVITRLQNLVPDEILAFDDSFGEGLKEEDLKPDSITIPEEMVPKVIPLNKGGEEEEEEEEDGEESASDESASEEEKLEEEDGEESASEEEAQGETSDDDVPEPQDESQDTEEEAPDEAPASDEEPDEAGDQEASEET